MFDPDRGTESRKRKARVADIDDADASQHCKGAEKSSSSLQPGLEAEAVRRRESIENRTLLCRNVPNVPPIEFMKEFNTIMEDNNICFYERSLIQCNRAPVASEMQLVFCSAEMATRSLNLSGYILQGKAIYLERPPEYNGPVSSTTGKMFDKFVANVPDHVLRHYKNEKCSREIFVKNVPDGTSHAMLKNFLDRAIQAQSLNICQGSPITNCKVRANNTAFLIFRTPEEASAALKLENIPFYSGAHLQFEGSRSALGSRQYGTSSNMVDSWACGETSRATGESYRYDLPRSQGSALPETGETSRSAYPSYFGSCDPELAESPRNASIEAALEPTDDATTDYSYYGPCSSEPEGMHPLRSSADTPTGTSVQRYYGPCDPELEGSPPSLTSMDTDDDAPSLTHDENEESPTKNEYGPGAKEVRCMPANTKVKSVASPQVQEHILSDAELTMEQPGADLTKLQVALDGATKDLQIQIQTAALEKAELRRQLEEMAERLSESQKSNACLQQEAEEEKHRLDVKGKELLVFRKRWGYLATELDKTRRQLEEAQAESENESSDDFEESPAAFKFEGSPVKSAAGIQPHLRMKQEPVYGAVYEEVWDL
jgi:hypothetical protein